MQQTRPYSLLWHIIIIYTTVLFSSGLDQRVLINSPAALTVGQMFIIVCALKPYRFYRNNSNNNPYVNSSPTPSSQCLVMRFIWSSSTTGASGFRVERTPTRSRTSGSTCQVLKAEGTQLLYSLCDLNATG